MRCAPRATPCMLTVIWCHSECCVPSGLDIEAAGGSVVHYYNLLLWGHQITGNMTWALFVVKCRNTQKSGHSPLWQTCKVLCPWALFHKTILHAHVCMPVAQFWSTAAACMATCTDKFLERQTLHMTKWILSLTCHVRLLTNCQLGSVWISVSSVIGHNTSVHSLIAFLDISNGQSGGSGTRHSCWWGG